MFFDRYGFPFQRLLHDESEVMAIRKTLTLFVAFCERSHSGESLLVRWAAKWRVATCALGGQVASGLTHLLGYKKLRSYLSYFCEFATI